MVEPQTTYVLDETVLSIAPLSIFAFDDGDVVIPQSVLRRMAAMRQSPIAMERVNAKALGVAISHLSKRSKNSLCEGVAMGSGGLFMVKGAEEDSAITCAKRLAESDICERNVILVSVDPYQRTQANLAGLHAEAPHFGLTKRYIEELIAEDPFDEGRSEAFEFNRWAVEIKRLPAKGKKSKYRVSAQTPDGQYWEGTFSDVYKALLGMFNHCGAEARWFSRYKTIEKAIESELGQEPEENTAWK